ncbi:MAG: F0F1 ATP synthase subunit delta [Clostridiales bacterium]|jgi:F0F1-type ATP synthase delta subunit|nr:F0F1 ATP synthase subunit delta [Clostridiales bacterium]
MATQVITVTTAQPVTDAVRKRVEDTFTAKHAGEDVVFFYAVRPEVLGGVLVVDGTTYYDGTVKTQLDKVLESLQ